MSILNKLFVVREFNKNFLKYNEEGWTGDILKAKLFTNKREAQKHCELDDNFNFRFGSKVFSLDELFIDEVEPTVDDDDLSIQGYDTPFLPT